MNKAIVFIFVLLLAITTISFAVSFEDMDSTHWAYEPVKIMANQKILSGYPDGTFRPNNPMTRAEFSKVLVLALDLDSKKISYDFCEEDRSHWAYSYIKVACNYLEPYARSNGEYSFRPDEGVLREDVAKALVLALGLDEVDYESSALDIFTDKADISKEMKKYVSIAVKCDLIHGFDDATFRPQDTLTRAQLCQLVKNTMDIDVKAILQKIKDEMEKTEEEKEAEEEAKKQAEEEKQKLEEEAKQKAEEEAKQKAEEEAKQKAEEEAKKQAEEDISDFDSSTNTTVVPTMRDAIAKNSAWCATFQLVWNDMKNEVVKKDIVFNPQLVEAINLNKEEFTESMISSDYYYKKYGKKTLALRDEIKQGIKDKFNQESDVLDQIDWSEDALDHGDPNYQRYLFYVMLYREFEYPAVFDVLDKGTFGQKANNNYKENVEYFGFKQNAKSELRKQVEVLYYNSSTDYAVILKTKNGDEVILCKNPEGYTFNSIYDNMMKKADAFKGKKSIDDIDDLKVPKLKMDLKRTYEEFVGKPFLCANGDTGEIAKAIQTIKFEIDEKGGKIKSEAVIDMIRSNSVSINPPEPRHFYFDDTYALFLREEGRELPYFAVRIDDLNKF